VILLDEFIVIFPDPKAWMFEELIYTHAWLEKQIVDLREDIEGVERDQRISFSCIVSLFSSGRAHSKLILIRRARRRGWSFKPGKALNVFLI